MGDKLTISDKNVEVVRGSPKVKMRTIVVDESGFKKRRRGFLKAEQTIVGSKKLKKIFL